MDTKATGQSEASVLEATHLVSFGKERAEAVLDLQKDLLAELEKAGQFWINRMKSEIDLWSDLSEKVAASHSISERFEACSDCVARRMKMAVEDGQRMVNEGRGIMAAITKSLNGQPAVSQ